MLDARVPVSPRHPTPDPLDVARAFADEAKRARSDWRRALVAAARHKLDEATVGLQNGEAALQGRPHAVAKRMRETLEKRRGAIAEMAERLDAIERRGGGGGE